MGFWQPTDAVGALENLSRANGGSTEINAREKEQRALNPANRVSAPPTRRGTRLA